ncbi:MAG TPA: VWA domain-containing protein [Acidobacteriota bacterium]|nr:VWA domain-containing protein [Acidobacteriota bacterium]
MTVMSLSRSLRQIVCKCFAAGLPACLALLSFAYPLTAQDRVVESKKDGTQQIPRIRVSQDLVLVRTTVTDPLNRFITGLQKEDFRVFEDKVEQEIVYFGTSNSPVSVGLILDTSGSMKDNIATARSSLQRFMDQGDSRDEYFLITFNQRSALVQDFTSSRQEIVNKIAWTKPTGQTALYDAIYLGLEKIEEGQFDKKALIVVSDGETNSDRYTFEDIAEVAAEAQAQIYALAERGEAGYGVSVLKRLTDISGGRIFYPGSFQQLSYYVDYIHSELRHQYVLGFNSNAGPSDDEYRDLEVRVDPPEGLPRLSIRHRTSYYAPRR